MPPRSSSPLPSTDPTTRAVLDALRRLVRAFRVVGAGPEGPSPAQRFVIERLSEHPGASIGELAKMTHTDQSSVSVVVSRLVDAGMIERKRSSDDRRRAALNLTAKGRALAKKTPPSGQAQLLAALRELSGTRRIALARELGTLVEAMGIDDEPAGMFFEAPALAKAAARPAKRTAAKATTKGTTKPTSKPTSKTPGRRKIGA